MLTEQFIASVGTPTKAPGPGIPKDAAIFLHEFQPLSQQRQLLKKSATPPNCLAISPTHIYAAQADKGVVHVYGRDTGNQEATVPFTDKISSIALACDNLVLVLGTVEGRIFLWEIASGRQVSTPQSHLQAVTALAVDPTHNFLLSGSKDSSVNVWSIQSLLSFSRTADAAPLRTFSSHRDEITSVALGHSRSPCNFAVSISRDQTALVWNYRTGTVLRTYLLPSIPLCLDLDPADRAVYVGYEDGTLQLLDLYVSPAGTLQGVQNGNNATEPVQPPESSRWKLPESKYGAVTSVGVSFDGTIVLSGHHAGAILSWDVARGNFLSTLTQLELPGPVNNVEFLPVIGFAGEQEFAKSHVKDIMKPKFGAFDTAEGGSTPSNYALNVQFRSGQPTTGPPYDLASALTAPSFSTALIDQGLCELAAWAGKATSPQSNGDVDAANEDYMALDEPASNPVSSSLQSENESLKQQLEALRRVQKKTFEKMDKLNDERRSLLNARLSKTNGIAADSDDDEDSSD